MQSEISPSLTRLDAVLWFLRVQMWLSLVVLIQSFVLPYGFIATSLLQNIAAFGLPILLLALFPRVLASAMLGESARLPLLSLNDLRPLAGRCVGAALFVSALGRSVLFTLYIAYTLITQQSLSSLGGPYAFVSYQVVGTGFAFFLGFFLAFGLSIRDHFRERPRETDFS